MAGRIIIGIDGGGTGSRAALRRADWALVTAEGGPANAHSDPDGAVAALTRLVDDLLARAGLDAGALAEARICAGVAGCRIPGLAEQIADLLPFPARVVEDSVTAVKGALGPEDGTLASLGTGSFFARQSGGDIRHIGGWGFQLGDEASGAWLGRRALAEALRVSEGRAPADPLAEALLLATVPHPLFFAQGARPGDFARLAPVVFDHRATPMGARLIAETLAEVEAALRDLGHRAGDPLVMTGGLGRALAALLPDALKAGLRPAAGSALDGALALAGEMP